MQRWPPLSIRPCPSRAHATRSLHHICTVVNPIIICITAGDWWGFQPRSVCDADPDCRVVAVAVGVRDFDAQPEARSLRQRRHRPKRRDDAAAANAEVRGLVGRQPVPVGASRIVRRLQAVSQDIAVGIGSGDGAYHDAGALVVAYPGVVVRGLVEGWRAVGRLRARGRGGRDGAETSLTWIPLAFERRRKL